MARKLTTAMWIPVTLSTLMTIIVGDLCFAHCKLCMVPRREGLAVRCLHVQPAPLTTTHRREPAFPSRHHANF